jgi:hypothetical protein
MRSVIFAGAGRVRLAATELIAVRPLNPESIRAGKPYSQSLVSPIRLEK